MKARTKPPNEPAASGVMFILHGLEPSTVSAEELADICMRFGMTPTMARSTLRKREYSLLAQYWTNKTGLKITRNRREV